MPNDSDDPTQADIDPVLLAESGRASMAQDMLDEARKATMATHALTAQVAEALAEQLRRWKRAAILLGVGVGFLIVLVVVQTVALVWLLVLRTSDSHILERLDTEGRKVDELVVFVHRVQYASRCGIRDVRVVIPPDVSETTPCP